MTDGPEGSTSNVVANVHLHPAVTLREMIDASDEIDADKLVEMVIFAFENQVSRQPLVDLISTCKVQSEKSRKGIRPFVEWCRRVEFELDELSAPKLSGEHPPATSLSLEVGPPSEKSELWENPWLPAAAQSSSEAGRAEDKLYKTASAHKYWPFRPALDVSSATWNSIFDEWDPCEIICFYIKGFFKGAMPSEMDEIPIFKDKQTNTATNNIVLTNNDLYILEFILQLVARNLCDAQTSSLEMQQNWRRALITSSGLYRLIDGGLDCDDDDFCAMISKSPEWVAIGLIDFWSDNSGVADVTDKDEASQDRAQVQGRFIAGCLIKHLTTLSGLSGCGIDELESEFDPDELASEAYPFSSGATRYGVRRNSRRAAPRIQDVDLTGSKGISL